MEESEPFDRQKVEKNTNKFWDTQLKPNDK